MKVNNKINSNQKVRINIKEYQTKLKEIILLVFDHKITNIINVSQTDFLSKIEKKTKFIFDSKFKDQGVNFENNEITSFYRESEKELIENYKSINRQIANFLSKSKKNEIKNCLTDFNKHCNMTDDYALHNCRGKMYIIYEKTSIKFIVCQECKKIYYPSAILLFCEFCSCEYSSNTINNSLVYNLLPATWESFHCDSLFYDMMKCIKCLGIFYLNNKENNLFCKECNYSCDPMGVIWKCLVCKEDYKCLAKPYNKFEKKIYKKLIVDTLNLKQKAKPVLVPCCKLRVYDYEFSHKKGCDGELYQSDYKQQQIIVCSKCNCLSYYDPFIWTCPNCQKRFRKSIKELIPSINKDNNNINENKAKEEVKQNNQNVNSKISDSLIKKQSNGEIVQNNNKNNLQSNNKETINISSNKNDIKLNKKEEELKKTDLLCNKDKVEPIKNEKKLSPIKENPDINIKLNIEEKSNDKKIILEKLKENEETLKKLKNFKVEDYKILQPIGEGTNGVIYVVQNTKKEKFALKKIIVTSEYELNMFTNEYELIHEIDHPHVVKILGISYKILDDTTNVLYILMDLAKSDWHKEINLRAKNNNPYTEEELIFIIKELIESLYFLQKKNIAHRDIKPHNILIYDNNIYKLADFGEAKIVKMISKKQLGTLRGTELYMAPILFNSIDQEFIVEHNPYKSDVFSLGYCILLAATLSFNILYQLRKLSNKKEIQEVITKHLSSKFSTKFINLMCRMVECNEKFRMDFIQLKEFFYKNLLGN